jgi:hypothetical protein
MALTLNGLADRIDKMADDFSANVNDTGRLAARRASVTIVNGTPVDTGKARSNHRVTVGKPSSGIYPPYVPGSKLGIKERRNANPTRAQHNEAIDKWVPMNGRSLFFTNNVPYLDGLNAGTLSAQGSRFIEAAAAVARKIVKDTRWFKSRRSSRTP